MKQSRVRVRYCYNMDWNTELGWCVLLTHCFNNQLGVNFLPHELQASISELREIEVNAKIEGVFVVT